MLPIIQREGVLPFKDTLSLFSTTISTFHYSFDGCCVVRYDSNEIGT